MRTKAACASPTSAKSKRSPPEVSGSIGPGSSTLKTGATPAQLSLEFVLEAAALALVGAAAGIALAAITIAAAEPYLLEMIETGSRLFLITPRLVLLALGYALVMGVLAGGIPAIRASNRTSAS